MEKRNDIQSGRDKIYGTYHRALWINQNLLPLHEEQLKLETELQRIDPECPKDPRILDPLRREIDAVRENVKRYARKVADGDS
jgi:hypothetical protein